MQQLNEKIHDAEVLAGKYDNDLELAKALYTKGLSKMNSSDFVQVMDCMYVAYNNFMSAGALIYAMDCYKKICEVSEALKDKFLSSVKEKLTKNPYQDVI